MRQWLASVCLAALFWTSAAHADGPLVLETDLGDDVQQAILKGTALSVDPKLNLFDLSHEVPAQDVWTAAYQLSEAVPAWPAGTVFVALVDGGTDRPVLVAKLKTGQIVVGPDNGLVTLLADQPGLADARVLQSDLVVQPAFSNARSFAARDRYILAGALLASGKLSVEAAGPPLGQPVLIPYTHATFADGTVFGAIPDVNPDQGDVMTNINEDVFKHLALRAGERVHARIDEDKSMVWEGDIVLAKTPADVPEGEPFAYLDDEGHLALAINMGSFADQNGIGSGPSWTLTLHK